MPSGLLSSVQSVMRVNVGWMRSTTGLNIASREDDADDVFGEFGMEMALQPASSSGVARHASRWRIRLEVMMMKLTVEMCEVCNGRKGLPGWL